MPDGTECQRDGYGAAHYLTLASELLPYHFTAECHCEYAMSCWNAGRAHVSENKLTVQSVHTTCTWVELGSLLVICRASWRSCRGQSQIRVFLVPSLDNPSLEWEREAQTEREVIVHHELVPT